MKIKEHLHSYGMSFCTGLLPTSQARGRNDASTYGDRMTPGGGTALGNSRNDEMGVGRHGLALGCGGVNG